MSEIDDYEISMLGRKMSAMQKEIDELKRGSRSSQLGNSSVHGGYIPFFDDAGVERHRVGRMPDGTVTSISINNPVAPNVPKPPTILEGLGTLTIGVNGLTGDIPYDFGYVQVYVDGVADGRIMSIPGIWIAGPLDPESHSIQISAVNQSGKESAKTSPVFGTPNMPTERDFEENPVLRTEISDQAISTPQIAANAIQAAQVAANAIIAAAIKAGAVTADKLEAIMVIANNIVAGDPNGRNVTFNANGLSQYDELGQLLIQFGANPAGGNFLTIVDPANTQNALASLDAFGNLTCSGFSVNGSSTLNGESLSGMLDALPRGLVAVGTTPAGPVHGGEQGFMELAFDAEAGRAYRLSTTSVYLSGDPAYVNDGALRVRYTTNGARPTVTSALLTDCTGTNGAGRLQPAKLDYIMYLPTGRTRLLFTMSAFNGLLISADPGIANAIQTWVEDVGRQVTLTNGASTGGGGGAPPPAPVQTFTRIYPATASRSWNSASSTKLYQGNAGYGTGASFIGFDDIAIRAALAGAALISIELYLYSSHWYYNAGGTVVIGTHNRVNSDLGYGTTGGNIGNYPDGFGGRPNWLTSTNRHRFKMGKPEGRWTALPISILGDLQANICKGIILDAGALGNGVEYYGQFDNAVSSGLEPALRITYRK